MWSGSFCPVLPEAPFSYSEPITNIVNVVSSSEPAEKPSSPKVNVLEPVSYTATSKVWVAVTEASSVTITTAVVLESAINKISFFLIPWVVVIVLHKIKNRKNKFQHQQN